VFLEKIVIVDGASRSTRALNIADVEAVDVDSNVLCIRQIPDDSSQGNW
jgi:hypothetical protein